MAPAAAGRRPGGAVALEVETRTGLRLDDRERPRVLDADEWQERLRRLREME